MGQLTLDITAVSQSSRGTFCTRGWQHVELQPTADACSRHMVMHLYLGQLSFTIQVQSVFLSHLYISMVLSVFVWMSSPLAKTRKSKELWLWLAHRYSSLALWRLGDQSQSVSLWWMNLCLACYTFEDAYELSCSVKACCYLLSNFVTVFTAFIR